MLSDLLLCALAVPLMLKFLPKQFQCSVDVECSLSCKALLAHCQLSCLLGIGFFILSLHAAYNNDVLAEINISACLVSSGICHLRIHLVLCEELADRLTKRGVIFWQGEGPGSCGAGEEPASVSGGCSALATTLQYPTIPDVMCRIFHVAMSR